MVKNYLKEEQATKRLTWIKKCHLSGQKYLRKDLATWAGTDFCITESVIAHARQPLVGILELDLRLLKY